MTFTAAVTQEFGGTPTGTVTFYDGTRKLGSEAASGGTASFTTTKLALGNHSIRATYNGNANFTGGTSVALSQTVN